MNYFFTRVFNKAGLLKKLNTQVKRQINKKEVIVPVLEGHGFDNLDITEYWMCELLAKVLPLTRGSFIDVGVNLGQTLIKLRTIDSEMDYIGFEPNPVCVYYTNSLIKANRYVNTRLIPAGLFNEDAVFQLNLYSEGNTDAAASVIENFRPGEKVFSKIFVPVYRFEQVNRLLNIDKIAVIKIDVEGAELEVLQSLKDTIQSYRPFILIEILPCYNEGNTVRIDRQQQIEKLLADLNYQIVRVIKKDSKSVKELRPLKNIGIHGDLDMCEYILLPGELSSKVLSLF